MQQVWAYRMIPKHVWLWVWYECGYITGERLNELAREKLGLSFAEAKHAWKDARKLLDNIPENEISLDVNGLFPKADNTPFASEVQDVYQIGDICSGEGWRTLHGGLQKALKLEADAASSVPCMVR